MKFKLFLVVAAALLLSGCNVFTGASTKFEYPTEHGVIKYSSPKEQDIDITFNDGKPASVKVKSTQNTDLASGAAAVMGEANKALAEAAGKLIDKVP